MVSGWSLTGSVLRQQGGEGSGPAKRDTRDALPRPTHGSASRTAWPTVCDSRLLLGRDHVGVHYGVLRSASAVTWAGGKLGSALLAPRRRAHTWRRRPWRAL